MSDDEETVDVAPVTWLKVSIEPSSAPLPVTWLEVRNPSLPFASTPNPSITDPPSAAAIPSMLIVDTPLASPSIRPWAVARTRTTWFIVGSSPSWPPFRVAVPAVPGRGRYATDGESWLLLSRSLPLGLLNVSYRLNAVGAGALNSAIAPVAPGTLRTS